MPHPLIAYIAVAYVLSIAFSVAVGVTGGGESPLAFPLGMAAMFAPAVAVAVVVIGLNARPPLGWNRFPPRYLPLALLLMPVVMHVVMPPLGELANARG